MILFLEIGCFVLGLIAAFFLGRAIGFRDGVRKSAPRRKGH